MLLEWEQRIEAGINASVHAYATALRSHAWVEECVPAYASLLVIYRGDRKVGDVLKEFIFDLDPDLGPWGESYLHDLAVCYEQFSPDLEEVADYTGLSTREVIERHTAVTYRVFFLGYQPGFGFLGELDPGLEIPRRHSPRTRVPAGSVGLAGRQTGIYPTDAPGGWQLIGRCPLPLLRTGPDATRLHAGDRVRFYPVTTAEFIALQNAPLSWPIR